jgi:hypothetical protein
MKFDTVDWHRALAELWNKNNNLLCIMEDGSKAKVESPWKWKGVLVLANAISSAIIINQRIGLPFQLPQHE